MDNLQLEIRDAGSKGQGVFTLSPIRKGTKVLSMEGTTLPSSALTEDLLALQVGPDLWLCSDGSKIDDMVNHSCEPNVGFVDGTPTLYAIQDIAVGEEICWDYTTSISEPGWALECCCGLPKCRGIIRPWGELSSQDRKRLRPSALNYLRSLPFTELTP